MILDFIVLRYMKFPFFVFKETIISEKNKVIIYNEKEGKFLA